MENFWSSALPRLLFHVCSDECFRDKGPNIKLLLAACALALAVGIGAAEEPDGLKLPPGFHATVVADGLGPVRHLAVRANGVVYVSTPVDKQGSGSGIIAIHLDENHKADQIVHFNNVDGGTGIRFYDGALYASSASTVYRFRFSGDGLVPRGAAQAGLTEGAERSLEFAWKRMSNTKSSRMLHRMAFQVHVAAGTGCRKRERSQRQRGKACTELRGTIYPRSFP